MSEPQQKSIFRDEYRVVVECLREAREAQNITQADLAVLLGRDQSYVSKYERAERRLDVIELRLICIALGTSLSAFIGSLEGRLGSGADRG